MRFNHNDFISEFNKKFKLNSLFRQTVTRKSEREKYAKSPLNAKLPDDTENGLHHISSTYLYTNAPPTVTAPQHQKLSKL